MSAKVSRKGYAWPVISPSLSLNPSSLWIVENRENRSRALSHGELRQQKSEQCRCDRVIAARKLWQISRNRWGFVARGNSHSYEQSECSREFQRGVWLRRCSCLLNKVTWWCVNRREPPGSPGASFRRKRESDHRGKSSKSGTLLRWPPALNLDTLFNISCWWPSK